MTDAIEKRIEEDEYEYEEEYDGETEEQLMGTDDGFTYTVAGIIGEGFQSFLYYLDNPIKTDKFKYGDGESWFYVFDNEDGDDEQAEDNEDEEGDEDEEDCSEMED